MATRATTLFSTPIVKAYLGAVGTSADLSIEKIADAVTERIETMCGRKFVTRSVTRTCDAKGECSVRLPDFPLTEITSIRRRATLLNAWETLAGTEYEADLTLGIVYLTALSFYAGPRTCEVVYKAGYGAQDATTLPADIVQAGLDYCKFVFTRQSSGMLTASSMNQGGTSTIVVPGPPRDIIEAVMAHRKVRL